MKDGERAYKLYKRLLNLISNKKISGGAFSNLICGHHPFQFDGNMGEAAGMAELLLQSHTGIITGFAFGLERD